MERFPAAQLPEGVLRHLIVNKKFRNRMADVFLLLVAQHL